MYFESKLCYLVLFCFHEEGEGGVRGSTKSLFREKKMDEPLNIFSKNWAPRTASAEKNWWLGVPPIFLKKLIQDKKEG